MVRLPQKQLHIRCGHPFTAIKPIHTIYRHERWWRLVGLAMKDRISDLNWSSHILSQTLISPTANPWELVSLPAHGAARPSDLWGAPGLSSAGCLQMAFSKTGGTKVPTWFLGGEKGDWNCTAILVHRLETMNKLSFWRCCYISQR